MSDEEKGSITIRMKRVIEVMVPEYRRYKDLQESVGLHSATWKSWWHDRQRPTEQMIYLVARKWPEFAFWIVTGITDSENGHIAPPGTLGLPLNDTEERPAAAAYFRTKISFTRKEYSALIHPIPNEQPRTHPADFDEAIRRYGGSEKYRTDLAASKGTSVFSDALSLSLTHKEGPAKVLHDIQNEIADERWRAQKTQEEQLLHELKIAREYESKAHSQIKEERGSAQTS